VVDFSARPSDEAALPAEAVTAYQRGKAVLAGTTLGVYDAPAGRYRAILLMGVADR
jgi:hypothetical protein